MSIFVLKLTKLIRFLLKDLILIFSIHIKSDYMSQVIIVFYQIDL